MQASDRAGDRPARRVQDNSGIGQVQHADRRPARPKKVAACANFCFTKQRTLDYKVSREAGRRRRHGCRHAATAARGPGAATPEPRSGEGVAARNRVRSDAMKAGSRRSSGLTAGDPRRGTETDLRTADGGGCNWSWVPAAPAPRPPAGKRAGFGGLRATIIAKDPQSGTGRAAVPESQGPATQRTTKRTAGPWSAAGRPGRRRDAPRPARRR
jgi:hypothetical protein